MIHLSNWLIVLSLVVVLSACATLSSERTIYYAVKSGDTLYSIAWRYQTTVKSIAKLNRIKIPYVIRIDDVIKVRYDKSLEIVSPKKTLSSSSRATRRTSTKAALKTSVSAKGASKPIKNWQWPLEGSIAKAFGANNGILKGILIKAPKNTSVVASGDGQIVYAGSGLRSYGRLIIIKHNESYLSAYGYLSKLKVKEGDKVKRGDSIAKLGVNAEQQSLLHFEIRNKGRPVDPITYLPKR